MNPLRTAIRRFDAWLSQVEGVGPFTDDPRCILRLQVGHLGHYVVLPSCRLTAGAKVLLLHIWNERVPSLPLQGPDLAYGSKLSRLTMASLKLVAQHILSTPSLQDIRAVGGVTAFVSLKGTGGGKALLERLGFTLLPYHRSLGAFGEFWENFYAWWLLWTFNPASLRHRSLFTLERAEFWMSQDDFLKRYG